MAVLCLSKPPALPAHADYVLYKEWLSHNFYERLCSYCIVQHESLQIEHYEPIAYAPARKRGSSNLLLACSRCNRGKSDYHPDYVERRTRRHDVHGFPVLDVRADDFAEMFDLTMEGELLPKSGPQYERAIWNTLLLKLDMPFVVKKRAECMRILKACEGLVSSERQADEFLKLLIPLCAAQSLLFRIFDIPVSEVLQTRLDQYIDTHRPTLVT